MCKGQVYYSRLVLSSFDILSIRLTSTLTSALDWSDQARCATKTLSSVYYTGMKLDY